MQKRDEELLEVLNNRVVIRKARSILTMFSIYFFWMMLDSIFWVSSFPAHYVQFVGSNLVRLVPGFIICYLLFNIQTKLLKKYSHKILLLTILIIVSIMFLSIVDSALYLVNFNFWVTSPEWKITIAAILQQSINSFIVFIGTTGLFYIIYYRTVIKKKEEQIAEAITLASEAQLLMLRYQINPHFLFNSLNAIQSMIEKDKSRAKEMIGDLADFFRYTLSKNDQMFVTIKEELEAVKKYFAIQKDRFGNRLDICMQIDPGAYEIVIPFFLIHPLVENAIKYGFASHTEILRLIVKVELNENKLSIRISNSGGLLQAEDSEVKEKNSTKTGIDNIKKRLALFYPEKHEFSLVEKEGYVHSIISINLGSPNESSDSRR